MKARKPWSEDARARHREGVRRYRELLSCLRIAGVIHELAKEIGVDRTSITNTLAVLPAELQSVLAIEPKEKRLKSLRDLVLSTSEKIERGEMALPWSGENAPDAGPVGIVSRAMGVENPRVESYPVEL
jgi:hypothetical protein